MIVECMVFIVGVIIQMTARHVWQQFAVGRLVSGLGVGALSAAVPMVRDVFSLLWCVEVAKFMNALAVSSRDCAFSDPWKFDVGLHLFPISDSFLTLRISSATYQLFITFGILVACKSSLGLLAKFSLV